jgi:hypothetical protein
MCADTESLLRLVSTMPLRSSILSWSINHLRQTRGDGSSRLTSPARQIAFLLALLLSTPEPDDPIEVDEACVRKVNALLNRIFFAYAEMFLAGVKEEDSAWNEAAEIAMPAFLHYFNQGSLATVNQVRQTIVGHFTPFDDALTRGFGINATQALEVIDTIESLLGQNEEAARAAHEDMKVVRDALIDEAERRDWGLKEMQEQAQIRNLTDHWKKLISSIDNLLVIRRSDILSLCGSTGEKFWKCFVARRGGFQAPTYITDILATDAYSLFQTTDNEAFAITTNQLYTAAMVAFERFLLNSDRKSSFLERRDKFLETRVENAVRDFFPEDAIVLRSPSELTDGTHEHDLIVYWRKHLLVLESKASPPKEPFRNPEKAARRIARHFQSKSGIQKGFEQADRIPAQLRSGKTVTLFDRHGELALELPPDRVEEAFAICITGEDFGVLATDLSILLRKPVDVPYPWVASVNDLESIFRAWQYRNWTAERLLEYLKARALLHGRIGTFDELEVAGYMLKHEDLSHLVSADGDRIMLDQDYAKIFDEIEEALAGGPTPHFDPGEPPIIGNLMDLMRDEIEKAQPNTRSPASATVFNRTTSKPGRNQPCPCGSGLKHKKCCGRPG